MRRVSLVMIVMIGVALFRLSLVGRGAMAFLDETNYYNAVEALGQLRHGHLAAAVLRMSSNSARPGLAVLQLIPAALQAVPLAFGVAPSNPSSLLIPVTLNAIVSLVTLYLFWRISLFQLNGDEWAATVATGIYGLLANSNFYVRHLLATEPALCLGMATLWLALSRPASARLVFTIGTLAGVTMTVYPGYDFFAAIPGIVLIAHTAGNTPNNRARTAALFAAGWATVVAATELFCRIGGVSYVERSIWLSRRIDTGSYDEGWSFLPQYMVQVEHYVGWVLMAGAAVYVVRFVVDLARGADRRPMDWLVMPAIAAWMFQAANAAWLHKMVLYGRVIHPWMAFMVWATLDVIRGIRWSAMRVAAYATVIAASMVSWATYAPEFRRLDYPLDVLYRLGINTALLPAEQRPCQMWPWVVFESPARRQAEALYPPRADYVLVNFCMGPPWEETPLSEADLSTLRLVYRGPHFERYAAYGFEGFNSEQRAGLEQLQYDLRVYEGR